MAIISGSMLGKNKRYIGLSLLVSVMFMSVTSFTYITIYLRENGLSTITIGILLSIGAVAGIITQPIWGNLSDSRFGMRKTLLLTIGIGIFATLVHIISDNKIIIMVSAVFRTIAIAPMMTLIDSYVVSQCIQSDGKMKYGKIRLWGSISFALTAIIVGLLTERFGISVAFFIQIILLCLMLFIIMQVVENDNREDEKASKETTKKGFNKAIFNGAFILFVIYCFLSRLPDRTLLTFFPIILQDAGGSLLLIGIAASLKAAIEVPFFLGSGKFIDRFGARNVFFFASGLDIIRMLGFTIFTSPQQIFLLNLLSAPTYCLFTAGTLHYVYEIAPKGSKTTAQMIVSAFSMSFAGVVSNSVGGFVLETYGIQTLAFAGLILIVIALTGFLIARKIMSKHETHNTNI